ncbi:hypothetical protein P8452_58282 [Trifolium repens]|nr:hypothetical protein P8452_58282 [Trifolium repens]
MSEFVSFPIPKIPIPFLARTKKFIFKPSSSSRQTHSHTKTHTVTAYVLVLSIYSQLHHQLHHHHHQNTLHACMVIF